MSNSSADGNSTSATTSAIQEKQYSLIWVGIGVSVMGNFLISLSFQIQKDVHNKLESMPEKEKIHYTKMPRWWIGLLCMAFGEVGNFLAYGMAPASLVSPLGAVTVVSNAILSKVILNESLSYRKLGGIVLCLMGALLISINAPAPESGATGQSDARGPEQPEYAIYDSLVSWRSFIYLCVVVFLTLWIANPLKLSIGVSEKYAKQQVWCYCLVCGLLGAITVMSSKGVSTAINQALAGQVAMLGNPRICWLTYILIISAAGSIVIQMQFLNAALETFDSSKVVPVYYIIFTTITISAGMCLFLEISFHPLVRSVLLFVLGLVLAFSGVYLIGGDPSNAKPKHDGHHVEDSAEAKARVTPQEYDELKLIFEDLDVNQDSVIDPTELRALAAALREEWPDGGEAMMRRIDTDGSGGVSLDEFVKWYVTVTDTQRGLLHEHAVALSRRIGTASNVVGVAAPGVVVYSNLRIHKRGEADAAAAAAAGEGDKRLTFQKVARTAGVAARLHRSSTIGTTIQSAGPTLERPAAPSPAPGAATPAASPPPIAAAAASAAAPASAAAAGLPLPAAAAPAAAQQAIGSVPVPVPVVAYAGGGVIPATYPVYELQQQANPYVGPAPPAAPFYVGAAPYQIGGGGFPAGSPYGGGTGPYGGGPGSYQA